MFTEQNSHFLVAISRHHMIHFLVNFQDTYTQIGTTGVFLRHTIASRGEVVENDVDITR